MIQCIALQGARFDREEARVLVQRRLHLNPRNRTDWLLLIIIIKLDHIRKSTPKLDHIRKISTKLNHISIENYFRIGSYQEMARVDREEARVLVQRRLHLNLR